MTHGTIHPRMTAHRRAWLEAVRADTSIPWGRTGVTNHCLRLGWADTLVEALGETMTGDDFRQRYAGDNYNAAAWNDYKRIGFILTDAGRAALTSAPDDRTASCEQITTAEDR